ncbi:hypothetical protein AK812_SmicGene4043 [Symbiodinium microadriaticum]|uniref:Uncharacterized protein n=1 Tax=Symbiodinium microadriaticum TaxID=2951 RepID=A0A1Q9EXD9_SYMMI|nr:hypothetical protein AK812_SmicGene4043 [Symbiodinium microadriaticum]
MASSRLRATSRRFLPTLYLLLQKLEKPRRQRMLSVIFTQAQRLEMERWLLDRRPVVEAPAAPRRPAQRGGRAQRQTSLRGKRSRCSKKHAKTSTPGVVSRRRNGHWRHFAVVVVQRLELRSKEVDCHRRALQFHAALVAIKQEIGAELALGRLTALPGAVGDEALAALILGKVTAVLANFNLDADRDMGLNFRAVAPVIGTTLCGPVFHPRSFGAGIAGWRYLQLARGECSGRSMNLKEEQEVWARCRQVVSDIWEYAGRRMQDSAKRLDALEQKQTSRREETLCRKRKTQRATQEVSRQERREARIAKILATWTRLERLYPRRRTAMSSAKEL